jgi:hypothetical protein
MADACGVDVPFCSWSAHNYKHFPFRGMTREHTLHGPARYLPGFDEFAIRALETATSRTRERSRGSLSGRTEYLRDIGEVIGWDEGQNAEISFVECSGSPTVRTFHGRPMHAGNHKMRGSWDP